MEDSAEDTVVAQCVAAATAVLDGWAGVLGGFCLGRQTWTSYAAGYPASGALALPLRPVISVTAVRHIDLAGAEQTLPTTDWQLVETVDGAALLRPDGIEWPETAPRPDAVRVTAVCGHDEADLPADLMQAVRLLTAHYYENRGAAAFGGGFGQLPMGVDQITMSYRRIAEIA